MSIQFKTIGLMGRHDKQTPEMIATFEILLTYLKTQSIDIYVDTETASALPSPPPHVVDKSQLGNHCDLVIVVGGDGSLLNAARCIVDHDIPLLGINRGHLGFLTDIHPDEVEIKVNDVLHGNFVKETRFLLTADIHDNGNSQDLGYALNDVVLLPGEVPHMIEFETYIDNQFVCRQRSDGLIVATPTGSTAYALSGGGPILYPNLDALVIVPMFPHTLSNRPIVIRGNSEIKIIISETCETTPRVSCDGQARIKIAPGSQLFIKKKTKSIELIHPIGHNFFDTLRNKLHRQARSY